MPWVWQDDTKGMNRYLANRMDPVGWIVALGDFFDEEISLVEVALMLKELQYTEYYQLLLSLREELTRVVEFQRGENIQQPGQPCPFCGRRCACVGGPIRVASTSDRAGEAQSIGEVRPIGNDPLSGLRSCTQPGNDEVGVPDQGTGCALPVQHEGESQPG